MLILAFVARSDVLQRPRNIIKCCALATALGLLLLNPQALAGGTGEKAQDTPSLFDLPSNWVDQDGRKFEWRSLAGHTTLVAMVYTTCQMACPLITREVLALVERVPASNRNKIRVVLATFDPARDTPSRLKEYAAKQKLGQPVWTLLSGPDDSARELAVVLGTQFKKLQNGEFSHSNTITVVAPDGRIIYQQQNLGVGRDDTQAAIVKSL